MEGRQRFVLLLLAVLVAVAAFIVIGTSGGGDDDVSDSRDPAATRTAPGATETNGTGGQAAPAKPSRPPTVVIRDGKPAGGVRTLRFRKDGRIVFAVRSDAAAEVHLHGYDETVTTRPGGTVRFSLPASIDGRFEVELEETATPIATVEVVP